MKIRILGNVNHNGKTLELYEKYDLADKDAKNLVSLGLAEEVKATAGEVLPEPEPTPRIPADPDAPYVAEAIPARELKPEEIDTKPVVPPVAGEPDPIEETVVVGDTPDIPPAPVDED